MGGELTQLRRTYFDVGLKDMRLWSFQCLFLQVFEMSKMKVVWATLSKVIRFDVLFQSDFLPARNILID